MSRLIRLPCEIRQSILKLVLGDNLIHLKYRALHAADTDIRGVIVHALCVATISEDEAHKAFLSDRDAGPQQQSWEAYRTTRLRRHYNCELCDEMSHGQNDPLVSFKVPGLDGFVPHEGHPRVDLSVLRICRCLYRDGTHILWATNTFSIEDPLSFEKFMASLTSAQKASLTKLHIRMIWASHSLSWKRVAPARLWLKLRSLRTVHLNVHHDLWQESVRDLLQNVNEETRRDLRDKYNISPTPHHFLMEPFGLLQTLPLRHVTVVITDNPLTTDLSLHYGTKYRWPLRKKRDAAERLRAKILDPNGRKTLKTETKSQRREMKAEKEAKLFTSKQVQIEKAMELLRIEDDIEKARTEAQKKEMAEKRQARNARRTIRRLQRQFAANEQSIEMGCLGSDEDQGYQA